MAGDVKLPTYDDLRVMIDKSRNFAVDGWSLTDAEADTALQWLTFLDGIKAPCPKIAAFDEGLQLVWPGDGARHYLALGNDGDGMVVNIKLVPQIDAALTRSQP
jgi:hypothetical protein